MVAADEPGQKGILAAAAAAGGAVLLQFLLAGQKKGAGDEAFLVGDGKSRGRRLFSRQEAAVEAVSPAEGLRILNLLQTERKGGVFGSADKEALLDEILLEIRRETLGDGQLFYAYKRRNEPRMTTLYQTPDLVYYFEMDDNKYTPDIPDKEYNGGRTY